MSISYFVRYRGLPKPADAFFAYYRDRHARILAEFPGLTGLALHVPADGVDPFPVAGDGTDFLAQMEFADAAAFAAALRSPARARAREDFSNLPKGEAAVTHQAMRTLRLR